MAIEKIRIDKLADAQDGIEIKKLEYLKSGGEADIYRLDPAASAYIVPSNIRHCVKIYHEDQLTGERQEKAAHLCNRFDSFKGLLGEGQFAVPRNIVTEAVSADIVGFAMENLGDCPSIDGLGYQAGAGYRESKGLRLDDKQAVDLLYLIAEGLDKLHKSNIVIGDLNPSNILVSPKSRKPLFVDLDSSQIEGFTCPAYSADYLDPHVSGAARNADNSYKYNIASDIFSLAVIGYELLIGSHPCGFRSRPRPNLSEVLLPNKAFYIKLIEDPAFLRAQGFELLSDANAGLNDRLLHIKRNYPVVYQYFADVFKNDRRESLLTTLPVSDPRHPEYIFFNTAVNKTQPVMTDHTGLISARDIQIIRNASRRPWKIRMANNTVDSAVFKLFVQRFGIDYVDLITDGVAS